MAILLAENVTISEIPPEPYVFESTNLSTVALFTYFPRNPVVNETIIFDASSSYNPYLDGYIVSYEWDFGDGTNGTGIVVAHSYSSAGDYMVTLTVTDNKESMNTTSKTITVSIPEKPIFDTGTLANPYPSISGTHKGTITPSQNITVHKLYTYPCEGTGGRTEHVWISGNGVNESASWSGYSSDWQYIYFDNPFVLEEEKTYNYTIRTGSYPRINHHHGFSQS